MLKTLSAPDVTENDNMLKIPKISRGKANGKLKKVFKN